MSILRKFKVVLVGGVNGKTCIFNRFIHNSFDIYSVPPPNPAHNWRRLRQQKHTGRGIDHPTSALGYSSLKGVQINNPPLPPRCRHLPHRHRSQPHVPPRGSRIVVQLREGTPRPGRDDLPGGQQIRYC